MNGGNGDGEKKKEQERDIHKAVEERDGRGGELGKNGNEDKGFEVGGNRVREREREREREAFWGPGMLNRTVWTSSIQDILSVQSLLMCLSK